MGVPILGLYTSEDKVFSITLLGANASNGVITAEYKAGYSPVGPLTLKGDIGNYGWVLNKSQGRDGVAPFVISFGGNWRPEPRIYCIYDRWTGAYQTDNKLLMEGSRVYVNQDGVVQVTSLGTHTFSM
ncbi:MAG: hypothetical protein RLZZ592_1048 [Pseudomonadota bacterium]|jgi:hypothetical protein